MRIITGTARGTRLVTLEGDSTRPTSERAKEAIFSMLQFELEGREVLDLFGGSGQLGLEAVSRGAARATICDRSREAVEVITRNAVKTRLADKCRILCADSEQTLSRCEGREKFDIVFLDPPYASDLLPSTLARLPALLKPTSVVVCESGSPEIFGVDASVNAYAKYEIVKAAKYGIAYVTLLRPVNADPITKRKVWS